MSNEKNPETIACRRSTSSSFFPLARNSRTRAGSRSAACSRKASRVRRRAYSRKLYVVRALPLRRSWRYCLALLAPDPSGGWRGVLSVGAGGRGRDVRGSAPAARCRPLTRMRRSLWVCWGGLRMWLGGRGDGAMGESCFAWGAFSASGREICHPFRRRFLRAPIDVTCQVLG